MFGKWRNYFQARRNHFEDLAAELGYEFSAKDEYGLIGYMRDFKLFKRGHTRRIKNILSYNDEARETDLRVFDFSYIISAGNTHRKVSQSVFFIYSKELDLPQFYLRPEDFFQKVAKFFGRQDINFDRFPEFSEQYLLQSNDESRLRRTVNDDFMQFFTIEKKWYLEGVGYFMILYQSGKRFDREELKSFISRGKDIYEILSSDLV